MDLSILVNKQVVLIHDRQAWQEWKDEHKREMEVARSTIGNVRIHTFFRGEDPLGGGYVFLTETSTGYNYGAKSWEQAEQNHQWICDENERFQEREKLQKARADQKTTHRSNHHGS